MDRKDKTEKSIRRVITLELIHDMGRHTHTHTQLTAQIHLQFTSNDSTTIDLNIGCMTC